MNDTEIVCAANQVHAGVQGVQAGSRVPTLAREARQSLSESPVQALNKGSIENLSPMGLLEQLLGLLKQPMSHLAGDLDYPFFLAPLDHRSNVQVRPYAEAGSAHTSRFFDFFTKGSSNAAWIGGPAIRQDEQRAQELRCSANLSQQWHRPAPCLDSSAPFQPTRGAWKPSWHKPIHATIFRPFTRISSAWT